MSDPRSHTNGEPWLETLARDEGERSRRIDFLLPAGERRRVTIDVAHDSPEIRAAIGDALSAGRTGLHRKGHNGKGS